MCGVVGLFVGCPASAACPLTLATQLVRAPDAQEPYTSPVRSWYDRATVRRAPRRELDEPVPGERFFSPDLVPIAGHPLVRALPPPDYERVLVRHLYRYLDFTTKLEHLVVNRTLLGIAHGTVGVPLPEEMRFDAFKLYCDEAYHALFCADLARQVQARTGVSPALADQPYFLRRLGEILEQLPAELRALVELVFVIVSETLISATLAEPAKDQTVVPAVREVMSDHAVDEGRHHTYFVIFLRYLWARLDRPTRRTVGQLIPTLVHAFLRPDLDAIHAELRGYGLSDGEVVQVTDEVFTRETVDAFVRVSASQTVRHFASLDVLDDPAVVEEFESGGLLPRADHRPTEEVS